MPRHKADDAFLHLFKVAHGLGHAQHHAGMPHRVHRHGGGGHDKAAPGRHRQRDADGVPAAQHQRGAGLGQAGDQLRQRQAGLHIAAHRVQDHQQGLDLGVLLNVHQLGDDVLVLGGLLVVGGKAVALDGADDGQAVDGVAAAGGRHDAALGDQFLLFLFLHGVLPGGRLCRFLAHGNTSLHCRRSAGHLLGKYAQKLSRLFVAPAAESAPKAKNLDKKLTNAFEMIILFL